MQNTLFIVKKKVRNLNVLRLEKLMIEYQDSESNYI